MAFITPYPAEQSPGYFYNVDYAVGGGACGNRQTDVMLIQALLRIVHFELDDPAPPPPGETGIVVDGLMGPKTLKFILNVQRLTKANGIETLLDGVLDPFRPTAAELSRISKVHYALESLNAACYKRCKKEYKTNYTDLPYRAGLPPALLGELRLPWRTTACQYQRRYMR